MEPTDTTTQTETTGDEALAAFNRCLDRITKAQPRPLNIDVTSAIRVALMCREKYMPFAEEAKKLPQFDVSCFDAVADYGLALREAHGRYLSAVAPGDGLAALMHKASEERDLLLSDAETLAKHGLVEASRVTDIARSVGYRGVAYDIRRLLPIFRDNWKNISGRVPWITAQRLDDLGRLSDRLINDEAMHAQAASEAGPAALIRQQTFTLFFEAYDQIRRAITYLRWVEGDVDDIAPSLFTGRTPQKQTAEPEPEPAPAPQAANPQAATSAPNAPAPKPGLPGASPYLDK